jgi:acetyl esterase/lipase
MKTILKIAGIIVIILVLGGIINTVKNKNPDEISGNPALSQTQQSSGQSATSEPTKKDLILRDVKYGTDKRNTMNVFVPKGSNNKTPFILFMHGGAWVSGDKNDVAIVQLALGGAGVASASINYRYASDTVHYTELMSDVNTAVNYIVEHGKDWNVDTNKISIGGISAGAHMALLYGYQYDKGNHISSIISMAGPSNIADVTILNASVINKLIGGVEKMVGTTYTAGQTLNQKFANASPINFVKNVPTLIIHGTADVIVPYAQAELLSVIH